MATQTLPETRAVSAAVDVRIVGVRKTYGDVVAVAGVDLDIDAGEFFTLLGPSGSGKTTTLRLIAGFERPDAGRIELSGVDVTSRAPYERDVNTVFQDYALFPHMTVADNVGYGLRVKGVPRAERKRRVAEALELVKRYKDVVAVGGIDLHIPPGEFFTMLGPSGCGKTTTLRLIAGFERPDGGAILLDGVDVSRTPAHKRRVNTVFQSYALFPHKSVVDNVGFGLRYQRTTKEEARRRVAEAMALVRLEGFTHLAPHGAAVLASLA